jgi:hypothetical protein
MLNDEWSSSMSFAQWRLLLTLRVLLIYPITFSRIIRETLLSKRRNHPKNQKFLSRFQHKLRVCEKQHFTFPSETRKH